MRFVSVVLSATLLVCLTGCVSAEDRFSEAVQKVQASIRADDLELAKAQLIDALRILPESEEGAELEERIDSLIDSKNSFEAAEVAAAESDFESAIQNLAKVSDLDSAREKSRNELTSTVTSEWNELLLKQLSSEQGTETPKLLAVEAASALIKLNPPTWEAYELLVTSVSESFAESGDYKSQFEFLSARTPTNLPTSFISDQLARAQVGYEEAVKTEVNKLLGSNDLDNSQKTITAALLVIPTSKVFQNLESQQKEKVKAEETRLRTAALAAMSVDVDSFEGISWYNDRATVTSYASNRFKLYIGKRETEPPFLIFEVMYFGDDWVFFDEIKANVDGDIFTLNFDYFDVARDNSGGNVWEWIAKSPGIYELDMINAIIASENTTIRFIGDQSTSDRTLSAATKRGLKNVLLAYEALGGE